MVNAGLHRCAVKRMAAGKALAVVQHLPVEGRTDTGTGNTAGGGTEQAAEQRTGQRAKSDPDRAGNCADSTAEFGAAQGSSSTADGATGSADEPAGFLAEVT